MLSVSVKVTSGHSFGDQLTRIGVGNDHVGVEGGGPQRPHCVIVREDQIPDRLCRVLTEAGQPLAGHHRCRPGLECDDEVVTFYRSDVGVPLGGERVDAVGEQLEGFLFRIEVGCRREWLGHESSLRVAVRGYRTARRWKRPCATIRTCPPL